MQNNFSLHGFSLHPNIYTPEEIQLILYAINQTNTSNPTFRKSADLFAIRQFLKELPETIHLIFTEQLKTLIREQIGMDYFVVKSIYFDKPALSNWYVSYHQDLTISVDKKLELPGYGPWTVKQNQFAVQAPVELLEQITTIRIHLDDTDENNGALRVIPGSHLKKIYRPEQINWEEETELSCAVPAGGVMIMKPLLLHSSGRSTNEQKRRVVHIELCNKHLPDGIEWAERLEIE